MTGHLSRVLATAFWSALLALVVTGAALAARSSYAASPDAASNLETARNIALGRGFTTRIVQQLADPQVVPGPEVVRPPGLPYLLAALSKLGPSLPASAVIVNLLAVLATALLVRWTFRLLGETELADLAGIFVIAAHAGYTMLDAVNNTLLTAITAGMLFVAALARAGRLSGLRLAIVSGAVVAVGFLTKQTFMLGAIPLSIVLLWTDGSRTTRARVRDCAIFFATFGALAAPYLIRNLALFGNPLYAPANGLRLPVHYDIPGDYSWHNRVVLFGERGFTYRDIIDRIGLARVVRRDLYLDAVAAKNLLRISVVLVATAGVVVLATLRRAWKYQVGIALLLIMPVFDGVYWIPEPRYIWPATACLLAMIGVGAAAWRRARTDAPVTKRSVLGSTGAIAIAMVAAIVFALPPAIRLWRQEFADARPTPPEWTTLVRSLPPDARIISASPYLPAWYGERTSIVAPLGGRRALLTVLAHYHPDYYMELTTLPPGQGVAFLPDELQLVGEGTGWRLHRLVPPAASLERGEMLPTAGGATDRPPVETHVPQ